MSSIQSLPDTVLSGDPYPVQALFLYYSNPVFSKPDGKRWVEAFRKIPLVVSFSPLKDESTFWADYVLPDPTCLERWEFVDGVPSVGRAVLGMRSPAVPALHDTMPTGDVVIRLARSIGALLAEAFP